MKKQTITVIFKDLNNLTIKKDRSEWIDELTKYTLNLALLDDDYSNGILDEFLRSGFKGYDNMTENEIISEVIEHLEDKYDMENA